MEEACTAQFIGTFCMMNPEKSWAARYQSATNFKAGVYAVKVEEQPGFELREELEKQNIIWISKPDLTG